MKIFIYPNFGKSHSRETTDSACSALMRLGCEIIMPSFCANADFIPNVMYIEPDSGARLCDIMISVGGDGTILKCAKLASKYDRHLLGINCGRLGFMATLERSELSLLDRLITGEFETDERMMLDVEILNDGGVKESCIALNEAVVSGGYGTGIRDFTVLADGQTVSSLRADGLIFSTPTGASAYSLSAGGPLIEPSLDCIEFTQICPHSLFARTMLFSPEKLIEIKFDADRDCTVSLSVDGLAPIRLEQGDRVTVRRSARRLKLIDISGNGYFRAVNRKLMQPVKQTGE